MTIAAPDEPLGRQRPARIELPAAAVRAADAAPEPKPLLDRALRFGRSLLVGAWASALDFAVLAACIRWFELDATLARVIALVTSGVVLFFGNRSFAFHAQAGSLSRQARLFFVTELIGLVLNLGVFRLLVEYAAFLPPELAGQAANTIVFLCFCYPTRAFVVFRVTPPARGA